MMNMPPKEVPLYYKADINNNITLLVTNIADVHYEWEYCKAHTVKWSCIASSQINMYTINFVPSNGDKFRCRICQGKELRYYSKVLTIEVETDWEKMQEKERIDIFCKRFSTMDGDAFEQFCITLLTNRGYYNIVSGSECRKYGVDLCAFKDGIMYVILCKCFFSPVGKQVIENIIKGQSNMLCNNAIIITNSVFVQEAIDLAGKNNVLLWDKSDIYHLYYYDEIMRQKKEKEEKERKERERQEQERQERERKRQYEERAQREKEYRKQKQNGDEHKNKQQGKSFYEQQYEQRKNQYTENGDKQDYFEDCHSWQEVHAKHKRLMKIYHTDNVSGSEDIAKEINIQYDKLRKMYHHG